LQKKKTPNKFNLEYKVLKFAKKKTPNKFNLEYKVLKFANKLRINLNLKDTSNLL